MSTIAKFRAAFGDMAIRSVHRNVARLDAARAFLNSEDWPPTVVSIAEARAQRLKRRPGRSSPPEAWMARVSCGCRPQKNASVRISMLSRGRASGAEVGSWKAAWAVQRARPSASDS
jgi:hypothetical protein